MKKIKSIILLIALFIAAGALTASAAKITTNGTQPAVGNGNSGSPYEIRTAAELRWFVHYENTRHWYPNDHAKLMCDIDLAEICGPTKGSWIPLGYSEESGAKDHWYGKLDGNGYTVKNLYIDGKDIDAPMGFMGKITGAHVIDLTIEGEIINGKGKVGGLAGWNYSDVATIHHCVSHVTIVSNDDNAYIGGLIGHQEVWKTIFEESYFYCNVYEGTINYTGKGNYNVGGVAGYWDANEGAFSTANQHIWDCSSFTFGDWPMFGTVCGYQRISSCVADGMIAGRLKSTSSQKIGTTFSYCLVIKHLHGPYDGPKPSYENQTWMTPEEIEKGLACLWLNEETPHKLYNQTLGVDHIPYPSSKHAKVYLVKKYKNCTDYEEVPSNSSKDIEDGRTHNFEDGEAYCTICHQAANPTSHEQVDGYYTIASKDDYLWFAQLVNWQGRNADIKARLIDDIDFDKASLAPLKEFSGEIDGAGHTLSNFVLFTSEYADDGGLVGCLKSGGSIHDLAISGYIFAQPNTNLGAFAGRVEQGATLRNLRNDSHLMVQGNVYSGRSEMNIGGIVGLLEGTAERCINNMAVYDCSQKYSYSTNVNLGGVVGFAKPTAVMSKLVNTAFVGSSYPTGNVNGKATANYYALNTAPAGMYYVGSTDRKGCYYFFSNNGNSGDISVTQDQLGDGWLAWMLSGEQNYVNGGSGFCGQKIGTDLVPYPFVTAAHPGVYNTPYYYKCNAHSDYSNSPDPQGSSTNSHYFNTEGYCTECYTADLEQDTATNAYKIASAADWNKFAKGVNAAVAAGKPFQYASALLTADFEIATDTLTPINKLYGTINGFGRTITMNIKGTNESKRELVNTIESTGLVTFLNLVCDNQTGGELTHKGAIACNNHNTISNCTVEGGLLLDGSVLAAGQTNEPPVLAGSVGEQSGTTNAAVMDCIGEVPDELLGSVVRLVKRTADGFTLYDAGETKTFTTAEAKSGKMTYELSHIDANLPCVWGQLFGTDNEPKLYPNQTRRSASFVTTITTYSIETPDGAMQYVNSGTPVMPSHGVYMVYSDREACPDSYLEEPNVIVANPDGTYSAKQINFDPYYEHSLPIAVQAERFYFCSRLNDVVEPVTSYEGKQLSLLFPVNMPVSNLNGTVELYVGCDRTNGTLIFKQCPDDIIPANTPMLLTTADRGNVVLHDLENVTLSPMTGCHSVSIGGATHNISYRKEEMLATTAASEQFYYTNNHANYYYDGNANNDVLYDLNGDENKTIVPIKRFFTVDGQPAPQQLQIVHEVAPTTLTAVSGVLNSICSEFDGVLTPADGAELDIYVFAGIHDGYVYGIPAEEAFLTPKGQILAGLPYIFVTNGESLTFTRTFHDLDYRLGKYGEYSADYLACANNGLQGVLLNEGAQLHGHDYIVFTRNGLKYAPTGQYTEGEKTGQDKTVTVGRGKCFINNSQPAQASYAALRLAPFDDEADGISPTPTLPDREGDCYNLQGQKVGDSYKGILIKNGKKIINK